MKRYALASLTAICLVGGLGYVYAQTDQPRRLSNAWLLDAPNDTERFRLLQQYLRGFDQPMWEVGERYQKLYDALKLENYDMALYQWDKIKVTIQSGYLKRPARKANADAFLLDQNWAVVDAAFKSRNKAKAWDGFELARNSCMSCHEAEKVGFMNNQPLFHNTMPPAKR